jgi:hypothetical protein
MDYAKKLRYPISPPIAMIAAPMTRRPERPGRDSRDARDKDGGRRFDVDQRQN